MIANAQMAPELVCPAQLHWSSVATSLGNKFCSPADFRVSFVLCTPESPNEDSQSHTVPVHML